MGTIAQELTRINTAKTDIKASIESKGVQVPSDALISTYSGYIDQIQQGGPAPVLTTLTANSNGTYTPGAGVDGYDEVIVDVGLNASNFTDATDLFYGGRLLDVSDKILPSFTGTILYETFGMTSNGPTQEVANAWCKKAVENATADDLVNLQRLMAYNTTYKEGSFKIDLSDVVLTENILFSIGSFCVGGSRCIDTLELDFDNSEASPYKLVAISPSIGQSLVKNYSIKCWLNGGSANPVFSGYIGGKFDLIVYKNVNADATTTILTNGHSASKVPIQTVADSIPYYANNIGPVVWRLPSATYDNLTTEMINQAAQYNLTFTT